MYGEKYGNLRTFSREYDCPANIGTKEAFTLLLAKLGQRATCADSKQSKTKIYGEEKNKREKTSPFVADFACNR